MGTVVAKCKGQPETTDTQPEMEAEVPQATREKKRFNPFFQPNFQSNSQVTLHERYRFLTRYQDRFLGECTVIEQIQGGGLFLLKDTQFKTDALCRQAVERLKNKKLNQQDCEGILRIVEVYGKRIDGLINNYSKVTMIMEYPLLSLKREFNHRLLNKTDFATTEIADVVFSSIKAYAFLEKAGCSNDKVRMAHIFVGVESRTKESKVKVIDSDLLMTPSNYQAMLLKGAQAPQNHDIYLAPQQFNALVENKQQPPSQDRQKAAVFSLGASILDLCVMSSFFEVYHFHNKEIKKGDIRGLVNVARKRHGLLIFKLLTEMLQFELHKRPTFSELEVLINKPMAQSDSSGSALRLSTVRDVNSKYLHVARHSTGSYGKISQASMMSVSMADRQFCKGGEYAIEQQQQLINMHEIYTNGNQYIGQKKNDLKHGKGKYIFNDHSYYEGWWKDDMMHGEGLLYFANGKVEYHGEWALDEPNGWGVLYAPSDFTTRSVWTRYEGDMRNGEMHGRGKLFFVDGTIFEGEFQNGKIFGRGCRIDPNGTMVQKEWDLTPLCSFLPSNPQEDHSIFDRMNSQRQHPI